MEFLPAPERQESSGRTLLMKFGAFTCRGLIMWVIVLIPCALLAQRFFGDGTRDDFNMGFTLFMLLGLAVSFFNGVLGWLGYTKLNLQHQKNWGYAGLFIFVLFILWMLPTGDSANDYMDEKLWRDGSR